MNKILIILLFVGALVALNGKSNASEMLSRSDIRLLYDFAARVKQGKSQVDKCLTEVYEFNSEGYHCTILNIKLRILKNYRIRISNLDQVSLNEYVASNNKLNRSFDDYDYILSVDVSIRNKLNKIDKEIRDVIESINS